MFIVACSLAQPDCRNFLPDHCNTIIKQQLCGEQLPSLLPLLQVDVFQEKQGILQQINLCPSNKPKKACTRPCDTNNSTVLQECTTILQLKVYIVKRCKNQLHTHLSRSVLSIWLYSFFHLLQTRSPDHQFFLFFIHEVSHHKVRNVMDSSFWKKVQMGLAWRV